MAKAAGYKHSELGAYLSLARNDLVQVLGEGHELQQSLFVFPLPQVPPSERGQLENL